MKEWRTPEGDALRLYLDILQQPHTLIAGTTGSGKSCAINGIIYTALYRAPTQARFVLIDPKLTELSMYKDLPHTAAYCTDPAEAVSTLQDVFAEVLARCKRAKEQKRRRSAESDIYIFIDELGDLISRAAGAVDVLADIARIGRAANVHLIGATQCPNRKTLSADFAANCPARLGLRCRDPIESRQIIGCKDATRLPLYCFAYYLAPQCLAPQLVRIPYYDDEALAERVRWWTDQNKQPRRRWWQR